MGTRTDIGTIEKTVWQFIDRVRGEMPVRAAYLFGSFAHGLGDENSDIDVAIVSEELSGDRYHDNARLGRLRLDSDFRIEPWGFRPEDFNDDEMMPWEIMRTGIRIYPEQDAAETQQAEH